MPQPFQYVAPPSNDVAGQLTSGLNLGLGLAQKNFAMQQQQTALARQQQMQQTLNTLAHNPNAGVNDYVQVMTQFPELKDQLKAPFEALTTQQQQQRIGTAAPILAAVNSGRMDLATDLLQQHVDALRNSNAPPAEQQSAEAMLKLAQQAPDAFKSHANLFFSAVMDPAQFTATYKGLGEEGRANTAAPIKNAETQSITGLNNANAAKINAEVPTIAPKAAADIRNINSQIDNRGGQLVLDRDKLISETQVKLAELAQKSGTLQEPALKIVNDSAIASIVANSTAAQMRDLAGQFEAADPRSFTAGIRENLARMTGREDYVTQLRKEYDRLTGGEIMKMLPPGSASNADRDFAARGFLPDTADAKQISNFLNGMARMQDYQAQLEDAKAQWVAANGHLANAKADLEINGVRVPARATFMDYVKQVIKPPGAAVSSGAAPKPVAPAAKTGYMQKYGTTPGGAVTAVVPQ